MALSPSDANGNLVFNFALARVRMRGRTQDATNVRVFFRLFPALSTSTAYDEPPGSNYPNTGHYRFWSDGVRYGQKIALPGVVNNEYVTMPCFAEARVNTTSASMTTQHDTHNVQPINHDPSGAEVDTFFGCWLDINQPTQLVLPATPPTGNPDGSFSGTLQSIQQWIRNQHQCLIAEIAFDDVTIPQNADPSISDKLAQRNLAFGPAPNPGVNESRRVPQTFEMRATPLAAQQRGEQPDELMIDWGNTPAGSSAQIYLPAVSADEVLKMAHQQYTTHLLQRIDAPTLQCPTGGVTYIPIPAGANVNYAGLLTVDLPATVKKGQVFKILVRQVTSALAGRKEPAPDIMLDEPRAINRQSRRSKSKQSASDLALVETVGNIRGVFEWQRVFGSFQITIPVRTKEVLLRPEERALSILRWIEEGIPLESRWYPVFQRYVSQIAGRVRGFGGNPAIIEPSPTGEWHKPEPSHDKGEELVAFTGKVAGLIYDRFGDFDGFLLDTEDGERSFRAREHEIEELVERAWVERILISVLVERHESHRPSSIILRHAPRPFQA